MSDGGFDPDEMIRSRREEENFFGTVVDPITKHYVSYPSVPKSEDIGKTRSDLSKGAVPARAPESGESGPWKEKQPKPDATKIPPQPEEGKNREKLSCKWVARGDTYPAKEYLKKAGMRWDPQHREWYSHEKPDIEIEGVYMMKTKA